MVRWPRTPKDGFKKGARTQNRTFAPLPSLPNFGRWFIFANDQFLKPGYRLANVVMKKKAVIPLPW